MLPSRTPRDKRMTKMSSRSMTKVLVALGAAATLALTACSGGGGNGNAGGSGSDSGDATAKVDPFSPEVDTIVGVQYQQTSAAPFLAAEQNGIAADYGLTLKLVPGESSPAMITQLVGGEGQVATASAWGVVNAIRNGIDLRIVGENYREGPDSLTVEALPDSGIKELKDLIGKKVGVVGLNSGHDLRIKYAMEQEGMDWSKVTFVDLPFGEMNSNLETGNIDAASLVGPLLAQAKDKLHTVTVFDYGKGIYEGFSALAWISTGDFVDKNPNAVAAFQCAVVLKGAELVRDDKDAYYKSIMDGLGWTEAQIDATTKVNYPAANDAEELQMTPHIMYTLGAIDEELDMSKITVPMPDNCDK